MPRSCFETGSCRVSGTSAYHRSDKVSLKHLAPPLRTWLQVSATVRRKLIAPLIDLEVVFMSNSNPDLKHHATVTEVDSDPEKHQPLCEGALTQTLWRPKPCATLQRRSDLLKPGGNFHRRSCYRD